MTDESAPHTTTAIDERNGELAIAKTAQDATGQAALTREVEALRALRHPDVVELIDASTTTLWTVLAGRSTLAETRPHDATVVARMGVAVLGCVLDLHGLGWAHGHLAPEHCIVG